MEKLCEVIKTFPEVDSEVGRSALGLRREACRPRTGVRSKNYLKRTPLEKRWEVIRTLPKLDLGSLKFGLAL